MKFSQIPEWLDKSLENFSFTGKGESHSRHVRKYFLTSNLAAQFLITSLLIICWSISIDMLVKYCMILIIISMIALTGSFFSKKLEDLIFFQQTMTLLATVFLSA